MQGEIEGPGAKGIEVGRLGDSARIVLPGGKEYFQVAAHAIQEDSAGFTLLETAEIEFFLGSYTGTPVGPEIVVPPAVLQRINAKR